MEGDELRQGKWLKETAGDRFVPNWKIYMISLRLPECQSNAEDIAFLEDQRWACWMTINPINAATTELWFPRIAR